MSEQSRSQRFRSLPPPVPPEALRAVHDPEPVHDELDDAYREQTWMVNSVS